MKPDDNLQTYDYKSFTEKFIWDNPLFASKKSGFKVFKIEQVSKYIKFPLPLHRTEYYDILFMKSGSSSKNCGLQKYTIQAGQVYFKTANQITSGEVFSEKVAGYFCLIEKDFISSTLGLPLSLDSFPFFKYGQHPIMALNEVQQGNIDYIFQNLHALFTANLATQSILIASWLNVLLQELSLMYQQLMGQLPISAKTNPEAVVNTYKDLIAQHSISLRTVGEYANILCVTANHLNRVVKQVSGKTASSFIQEMLLLEAKLLLTQTTLTISQIAFKLQFNDTSHFNRFFKKHSGMTPALFRKNA